MTHRHAHLREDPTNTEGIRKRFLSAVRQRFRALRGHIRRLVGYEFDAFEIATDGGRDIPDDIPEGSDDIFRFPTTDEKLAAFRDWIDEWSRENVLEEVPRQDLKDGQHWTGTFVRAAYVRGYEQAGERLQNAGLDTGDPDGSVVFNLPTSRRQLRELYTRSFRELQGITSDMGEQISQALAEDIDKGLNPKETARRITKEVRGIQRTRAEVLARTETINSYTTATIRRYEQSGIESVMGQAEFQTAEDERVCPICESINRTEFLLERVKSDTFDFESGEDQPDSLSGEYPIRPPVHPNCRCVLLPVVN
jgi:SPP1 gp7 family putative phage head morphogenesis protein